jgi:hypothetical protein
LNPVRTHWDPTKAYQDAIGTWLGPGQDQAKTRLGHCWNSVRTHQDSVETLLGCDRDTAGTSKDPTRDSIDTLPRLDQGLTRTSLGHHWDLIGPDWDTTRACEDLARTSLGISQNTVGTQSRLG